MAFGAVQKINTNAFTTCFTVIISSFDSISGFYMCTSIQKVIVGENFNAINSMHCIAYEYGLYKNKSANDIGEEML